jgi:acetamidase/formamidase
MKRLILRVCVAFFFIEIALAGPALATHHLAPTPKTVTWGYFDPSTPPVLRMHSGHTVEVETLPTGGIEALEEAGLPRSQAQPALLEVEREVKERGEVPHILTGPIWIDITMGFHENLEEAARVAVEEMLDFLAQEKHLDRDEAYILIIDAVDLRITQLVGPFSPLYRASSEGRRWSAVASQLS